MCYGFRGWDLMATFYITNMRFALWCASTAPKLLVCLTLLRTGHRKSGRILQNLLSQLRMTLPSSVYLSCVQLARRNSARNAFILVFSATGANSVLVIPASVAALEHNTESIRDSGNMLCNSQGGLDSAAC